MLFAFRQIQAADVYLIGPHLVGNPADAVLIGGEVGVGNEAVGQQIGVDESRHGGGIPLVLILELPVGQVYTVGLLCRAGGKQQCGDDK